MTEVELKQETDRNTGASDLRVRFSFQQQLALGVKTALLMDRAANVSSAAAETKKYNPVNSSVSDRSVSSEDYQVQKQCTVGHYSGCMQMSSDGRLFLNGLSTWRFGFTWENAPHQKTLEIFILLFLVFGRRGTFPQLYLSRLYVNI